jgi:hypothetical protein
MKFSFLTFLAALAGAATANAVEVLEYDLIAGQHIDVGKLTITSEIVGDFCNILEVEYTITDTVESAWLITETHLHIDSGIPQNRKGNPMPGQFEYSTRDDDGVKTVTYSAGDLVEDIPCGETTLIAAHAKIAGDLLGLPDPDISETAWGWGDVPSEGRNWAMYVEYDCPCPRRRLRSA